MSLTFKKEFKYKILSGQKVATIRNCQKLNVGELFEIACEADDYGEVVGKARCKSIIEIKVVALLNCLSRYIECGSNRTTIWFEASIGVDLHCNNLGFETLQEALKFYKTFLKNEYCYLHIFELIEEV